MAHDRVLKTVLKGGALGFAHVSAAPQDDVNNDPIWTGLVMSLAWYGREGSSRTCGLSTLCAPPLSCSPKDARTCGQAWGERAHEKQNQELVTAFESRWRMDLSGSPTWTL